MSVKYDIYKNDWKWLNTTKRSNRRIFDGNQHSVRSVSIVSDDNGFFWPELMNIDLAHVYNNTIH